MLLRLVYRIAATHQPFPQLSSSTSINLNPTPSTITSPTRPPIDPLSSSSLTLYFLKNSCGLPHATALSASKKIHIKTTKNPHSVLALLKSYTFAQPHIANIVARNPRLLLAHPHKILKPKLDFLQSIGFSGPNLVSLLTSNPTLLHFSLHNKLVPNYHLLKGLVATDHNVVSAVRSSPLILTSDLGGMLVPAVKALQQYGVPMNVLLRLLTMHVRSLVTRPNRFDEIFGAIQKIGISPNTPIFAHAFGVLGKLPDPNWKKKVENFNKFGWTEEQVLVAFTRHPYCMTVSTEKLAKNMQVFREELGWDPGYISVNPVVLSLSFEKRIFPRFRILSILKSKGLLTRRVTARHFMLTEKQFLTRYVIKYYREVPELVDDAVRGKIEDLGLLDLGQS